MDSRSQPKTVNEVVKQAIALVEGSDLVGLDIETTGLSPRDAEIRLIQVSDGEHTYIIDAFTRDVSGLLKALSRPSLTVLAHNAAFEYGFIYHHFGVALDNLCDTMLMAQLAACGHLNQSFKLEDLTKRLLDIELDKEMQTADWSGELTKRHLAYAARDAKVLVSLYHKLREEIVETGQELACEIEMGALLPVARMRLAGISIDKAGWDAHAREVSKALKTLTHALLEAEWLPGRDPVEQTWAVQGADCLAMLKKAGIDVAGTEAKALKDVTDNDLVAALLAYRKAKGDERERLKTRVLDLAPTKPPKPAAPWNFGSPQQVNEIIYKILGYYLEDTSANTFLQLTSEAEHPFFEALLDWRKLSKRESTYAEGWFKDAYDERTGRVYAGWRQIGAATGRFACNSPNLQNLPNDGPYRYFFRAPEGRTFVDLDYSQIEPRIYAVFAPEPKLIELYERENADVYRSTAAELLSVEESEVTKEQRNKAKAIVLGISYGLSAFGLPTYAYAKFNVKITPDEAEELIEGVFELYPNIEADHGAVLAELNERGFVDRMTLTGRRRDDITVRNEAINAPIQGTGADILKLAMAKLYKALREFEGAFIVGVFHDEILVECDEVDAEDVRRVSESAMIEAANEVLNTEEPRVPIEVDGGISRVWTKG